MLAVQVSRCRYCEREEGELHAYGCVEVCRLVQFNLVIDEAKLGTWQFHVASGWGNTQIFRYFNNPLWCADQILTRGQLDVMEPDSWQELIKVCHDSKPMKGAHPEPYCLCHFLLIIPAKFGQQIFRRDERESYDLLPDDVWHNSLLDAETATKPMRQLRLVT